MPTIEDAYDYDVTNIVEVETISDSKFGVWIRKVESDAYKACQNSYNPKYRVSFRADMMEAIKEKYIAG